MTGAVLVLAAAVLVAPRADGARRLARAAPVSRPPRRFRHGLVLAAGAAVAVALWVGVGVAAATAVAVGTAASRRHRRRHAARLDADRRTLLSGLETIVSELRVGAHPADACDTAARETTGPTSEAFRVAAARARLGGSASDGFRSAATTFGTSGIGDSLGRVADAWSVSDRHGLALAELLAAARSDLAARLRIRARTEAGLAGARATAAVLAALPVLGVGLGQLMGAAPMAVLLRGTLGGALLVSGTVLVCSGLLWTDHIAAKVGS